ncbi:hypothetical protein DXT96_08290 [Agrobacterium sp. ICMP 6402]|nr:hypothetical protein [Agrobacterium sp. ICMP 6402]
MVVAPPSILRLKVGVPGLPPSALPGISPTRREITRRSRSFHGQSASRLPIFPLVGEMPGRAEGGNPRVQADDR